MIELNRIMGIILSFSCLLSFGQKLPTDYDEYLDNYRKSREYLVSSIDSTEFFYVLKTRVDKNPAILVIYKDSKQLQGITLNANQAYTFNTYRHNDISSAEYEICHYIENREVWCAKDFYERYLDLHFTDSMGNETFEED